MERDADMECGPSAPYLGNGKSKLDTLSKEDLIKFAKKQMAVMQKLKAKCADLEKEVEVQKTLPGGISDNSVIQELTGRIDVVLLEKAETEQNFVLLQQENEQIKKQAAEAMENLLQLQEKLENVNKEHMESIQVLEKSFETSETKHREEFNSNFEAVQQEFESQVNNLQRDLELAKQQQTTEIEALVDTHQMALKKCNENLQNLQDEIARLQTQHEEDIGVLQEQLEMNAAHFDMERERFLKELAEQQVLKENFLQDVEEEEEEDFNSGTQKASGIPKLSDTLTLEEPNERLRLTLQELQSQNVMLQEELAFLTNVKNELEGNLKHIKEEFMMEREELEFKINELQMMKGDTDACLEKEVQILNELKTVSLEKHEQGLQELRELHKTEIKELETHLICNAEHEKEAIIQELKDLQYQCKVLAEEKTAVISEYEHTKEVLKTLEVELGERTSDFVKQYTAMKEHAATSIQELQEKLLEKDNVIEKLKSVVQMADNSECKAQMLLNIKNEDVLDELHKEECLVQDVGEIPIIMNADKEIVPRLEKIRTDIEHMLDECKFGQMDTVQLPPQALEDMSEALEGALAERKRLRNSIVHLEGQLSLSSSKKLRKCCDTLLEDQAVLHDTEQQTGSQTQAEALCAVEEQTELPSTLVESKALCHVSEMLKQKYSVIIAEEDIPALLNQLLSIVQKGNMIFTQQCNYQAGQTQASQQALQQQEARGEHQLQKTSEIEVLPHIESFQGDRTEMQTRNEEICPGDSEHLSEVKPSHEAGTQEVDDLKHLRHMLNEKEAIIAQLKEEISLLQEFKMSTCNKNLTRLEILEKEMKEKDERMNKIKAVAVKAKKELENSKKEASALREGLEAMQAARDKLSDSMKGIIHSAEDYRNLMASYDKQTEQLDKEREKLEGAERLVGDLTKRLQTAIEQHKQLCSQREDMAALIETLQSNVQHLEAQAQEMLKKTSGLERDLEAENLIKQQKAKDHQCTVKDLEEMRALLQKQKHHLQQTEEELEQLRKDAQQSTLLDMEMADYERLVKELNVQLTEKDKLLDKQVSLAQAQRDKEEKMHQEMEALKSLVDIGEEKSSKMKQLLVKTKKDLADAKKEEASQMMLQSSLKGELEGTLQQLESYKIQCSELQAETHRLQEELKVVSEQYQKACSSFQTQTSTLQNQLTSTQAELCSTLSEFESYKVRVHNVLKQQKSKSSSLCDGEFSKQERDHMENLVEQLRSKLQEVQQQLQSSSAEQQQLQTEHDMLLDRHSKMLQHTVTKEAELRERLLSLHSENSALRSEHSQSVAQLTAQADVLRTSFREQVHHLQADQRNTVETLQQQISRLEMQLFQLQQEPCSTGSAPLQQSRKPHHPDGKLGDMPACELQNMAREEGEGMETTEMDSLSTASSPPPTLEQLLTSPDPKQEPFVWQAEPSKEELSQKLNTATRSMEHMNSLLHESEATNAVLMEQISLLKSEMRRLERNQEREKSGANLEYLKNVLLRFMLLQAGSEKQALLPVIHTLLQLSPDEKSKLAAIAQGEEEAANSGRSGWTSYLHSWSGIR